jgi:type I restriction enzyme S subunit
MGKLVPQDPNDEPANVLLEKIAKEKAKLLKEGKIKKQKVLPKIREDERPFELPDGWEWVHILDISELITSGSRGWAKYYSDKGAIFITMGNLARNSYELRMDTIRYVTPPFGGEGSRTRLIENDLIISITGDVGNLGLIPPNFGEAYINQHACLLRFMYDCRIRYWSEFMRSPLAKSQFNAPQRGIKNSFRLGDVGEMLAAMPPLKEQHRIVTNS